VEGKGPQDAPCGGPDRGRGAAVGGAPEGREDPGRLGPTHGAGRRLGRPKRWGWKHSVRGWEGKGGLGCARSEVHNRQKANGKGAEAETLHYVSENL